MCIICGKRDYVYVCQTCKDNMALNNNSLKRRAKKIIEEGRIKEIIYGETKNRYWNVENGYDDIFEVHYRPDTSKWTCDCKSFVFNQRCSHIEAAKMIKCEK